MTLPLTNPPGHLCILRLSALGDVTHTVPVVNALRARWPEVKITWIIGKLEHRLLSGLPGVEFIVFDKRGGWAEVGKLRAALSGRQFDVLLHMQQALRVITEERVELDLDFLVGWPVEEAKAWLTSIPISSQWPLVVSLPADISAILP